MAIDNNEMRHAIDFYFFFIELNVSDQDKFK